MNNLWNKIFLLECVSCHSQVLVDETFISLLPFQLHVSTNLLYSIPHILQPVFAHCSKLDGQRPDKDHTYHKTLHSDIDIFIITKFMIAILERVV
jgi:hypothetical protein